MLGVTTRIIGRFAREDRGVVLVVFLIVFLPLLLMVAVVIDFSQTLVVKRQLASAVDSAALSLGMLPQIKTKKDMEDKAKAYIDVHYPDSALGKLTGWTATRDGESVNVSATAEIPTFFLGIAGKDKWTITVNSTVMRKENKLELIMVLDNTGSMLQSAGAGLGSKIDAMKSAANGLVDILFGDDLTSETVKIGLVPFTNGVNVNPLLFDTKWLDVAAPQPLNWAIISDLNKNRSGRDKGVLSLFKTDTNNGILTGSWKGCVRARAIPYDTDDTPPVAGATLFTPYFAPDEGGSGTNNYIRADAPVGDVKKYFAPNVLEGTGTPNFFCPAAVLPLTNVKKSITDGIKAMQADGYTVVPEGLIWGWRLISPGAPFTEGVPYNRTDVIKVIILLTDGENDVGERDPGVSDGPFGNYFNAYGYRKIPATENPLGANAAATLNTKTAQICNNIKAVKDSGVPGAEILLYTVAFNINSETIVNLMKGCATQSVDKTFYFNSPTGDALKDAFRAIALGLNELRLVK